MFPQLPEVCAPLFHTHAQLTPVGVPRGGASVLPQHHWEVALPGELGVGEVSLCIGLSNG